ncbi:hypothetical protein HHK36_017041 [Tetracentron sinense]|uniref:Uncharacterized protein n=1 Tax=Tetracentron sinense TaxID=13715 RepID=A0A835DCG2_TETSI|nr:hypothetical protein HHK36_017041 [Tetracentron sinense]
MAITSFSLSPSPFGRPSFGIPCSPLPHSSVSCSSNQLSLSPLSKALSEIHNSGVIACLRAPSGELAMEAARAALSGGISVLEIVMSTPGYTRTGAGPSYNNHRAGRIFQVGTVLNSKDAENAIKAGAKFLMSPAMVKDILENVQGGEVLYIPGVMTPTEVFSAYNAGARIVKVYPVSALGGVQYISTLKKPFSHIPMVASQGMTIDSIGAYIAGGASSVVLSDAIFGKEAMGQRNFDAIYQLARLAALQGQEAVKRCTQSKGLERVIIEETGLRLNVDTELVNGKKMVLCPNEVEQDIEIQMKTLQQVLENETNPMRYEKILDDHVAENSVEWPPASAEINFSREELESSELVKAISSFSSNVGPLGWKPNVASSG